MKDEAVEYLIICPLAFVAGFVDAIAGGGGLISLPAFVLAGLPMHASLGTNKLSSSLGTLIATIRYARAGYMVRAFVLAAVPCALVGSCAGSNAALLASDTALKVVMLVALPAMAAFVLRTKDLDSFARTAIPRRRALCVTAAIALGVGFYDGFYGPGTGTLLMLALTALARQDVRTAAGTTKAINLSTNLAALAVFLVNGVVVLPLGLAAGAFNIAGNYLGAGAFSGKGSAIARPVMLVVMALFFCKVIADLAGELCL